ncbi:MAG TPA: hypothetical protein VNS55_05860 [Nocardioides sp.]|nr:hypothetical protein [Nocardioides sp.]
MSGVRRAWGWVAALRAGETTPWSAWAGEGEENGPWLPGAQQLELLRRVNLECRRRGEPVDAGLAERVLTASAPGRGTPDLLLTGAGPEPRFGPRPVDPAALPSAELLRVATGLIAEDLVAAADRPGASLEHGRRTWGENLSRVGNRARRPWTRRYALVGHPWLVEPAVADLVRRGRGPLPDPERAFVLGADLETMVGLAWTARAFAEGGSSWSEWLAGLARVDRLPPRADIVTPARNWAGRLGAGRVTVVLDPALLPGLVGVRRVAGPPELGGAAVDLARRVGMSLGVMVKPRRRTALLRRLLLPRLAGTGGPPVAVPEEQGGWLADRAERMRAAVSEGRYAVAGDLDLLLRRRPAEGGAVGDPPEEDVLALATRLLLDPVRAAEGES